MKQFELHLRNLTVLFLLCALVLCGCSTAQQAEPLDPEFLNFPGTSWNMTVQQVQEALEISDDQWTAGDNSTYTITDWQVLGRDAVVSFMFQDTTGSGTSGLGWVFVYFPEEENADSLLTDLTEQLGDPTQEDAMWQWGSTTICEPYLEQIAIASGSDLETFRAQRLETYTQMMGEAAAEEYVQQQFDAPVTTLSLVNKTSDSETFSSNRAVGDSYQDCPALLFVGGLTSLLQLLASVSS